MATLDFEAIFDASPNAYMLLDAELRFVAMNQAYLDVTASRREDLLGRNVFDAFPNDPHDPNDENVRQLRTSFERVLATGKRDTLAMIVYRVPTHTPDGIVVQERVWSATHTPVLDERGRVTHILQHTTDISELHALRSSSHRDVEANVLRHAKDVQATNRELLLERGHLLRLFEQAPVFVCFLRGATHVFELVNPAYLQLVGHRDLIGKTVRDALPEIADQGFVELLDRVFSTGVPFVGRSVPAKLERHPGAAPEPRELDFVYQPIVDPDGTISGTFVLGIDITEQRATASERERLATIVEQSGDFIGVVDHVGKLVFMNEAGHELLGTKPEQLASLDPMSFFPPAEQAMLRGTITDAVRTHGHWRGDLHMRRVDSGELLPVDYHLFLLKDRVTGEVTGAASVTRDLREQQQLERERLFLADAIPAQVWTASPAGGLTYVNQRVCTYFERSAEDMLEHGWQDGLHPDDLAVVIPRWTHSLATGEPYEVEFRLRRGADQAFRWHIARALPMRDADGQIWKWYGTNVDIDDHKRVATERDALIGALEQSNQELDRFAYVASHDLKAPLRGIGNIAQWLEQDLGGAMTPAVRGHLDLLRRRLTHMGALIDGILRYARAGRTHDSMGEVDVGALLRSVMELLALPASVTVEIAADMPTIFTSGVALEQVFLNLVSNAVKHARRADAHVAVRVKDAGERWIFSVTDDGPGIAPEFHERVWSLFQTLPSETGEQSTGIGLSIVRKAVEARRGTVSLSSAPGRGATFSFSWPKDERPA